MSFRFFGSHFYLKWFFCQSCPAVDQSTQTLGPFCSLHNNQKERSIISMCKQQQLLFEFSLIFTATIYLSIPGSLFLKVMQNMFAL